ncbi:hypothetical protein FIBSPDRAFT_933572 [Athelia psychrophila]|uniref:Uncharacterized protein n=1 Tax=Athelia psychrophila TaxID=1759441 RepID=A0A166GZ53_9AGAM|nr:hypothetical protein FIBSPDRAFT_933572 [Fibularhizoctonia sp. CBS 109695]
MLAALYAEQLASLCLKLQEINSAREHLLAQLADLEKASRTMQHEYNTIFNNASAIATLPNEIISSIFEEEPGLELLVSQVTHRWRDVAISTPKLWSDININLSKDKAVHISALYLTRSKGLPFDLSIVHAIGGINKSVALSVGQMLVDHIAHCRRIKIKYASRNTINCNILLDFLIPVSAQRLESFDVTFAHHPREGSFQLADMFKGGAPVLAVVRLSKMPFCLPPLGSVTTLRLVELHPDSHIMGDRWRDVLVSLTRLISLEVEGDIMTSWITGSAITLPALRTLRIGATGDQEVAGQFRRLYEAIDAPSLEFLSLRDFFDLDLAFLDDLWPLGPNKFPVLHTLTLVEYEGTSSQTNFAPLLRAFPLVQTVAFSEASASNFSILRLLLKTDMGGLYWPGLRNLAFSNLQSFDEDGKHDLVNQCLTSRISMGHPIGTLAFKGSLMSRLKLQGTLSENGVCLSAPPWMDLVQVAEYHEEDIGA